MGQFNTRIQHKHDTEANWIRASRATNPFIPLLGEIIFYDADDNYHYTRMKIGDGEKTVDALPFIDAHAFDENGIIKQNVLPEGYPYMGTISVLPQTYLEVSYEDGAPCGQAIIVNKFSLEKDAEYEVIFNGVSYSCTAKEIDFDVPMIALGNQELIGGEYMDAPFLIANVDDEAALQAGYYGEVFVFDNSTEVNLSINGLVVKKIDNEYLDLAWLPTIVDGYDDGELLGEIDRSAQNNTDIDGLTFDNILKGQTYIVYYNGTRYTQVARETLYNELPIRYLGNLSLSGVDGTVDTGEPFIVLLAKIDETTIWANANDINGSTSFVLSVYTAVPAPEYNKMPEEFLPSSVVSKSDLDGLATEEYVNTQVSSLDIPSIDGLATETYVNNVAAGKADKTHTHVIADVSGLQSSLDAKVPTSRTINGKALTTNISLTASDVGALPDSTVIPSIAGLATKEYVNTQVSTKPGKFGTGSKAEIFNVAANKASGPYSHAEGGWTTASGEGSHAEGYNTVASGTNSHAEGDNTTASGENSHAEGYDATASGQRSHAEGYVTTAFGQDSHAEGRYTTAFGKDSHAEGSSFSNIIDLTGEANTTEYVYSNTHEYKNNDYFVVNGSIVFVTNVDVTNKIITVSNTLSTEAITNKRYTILRGIARGDQSHTEGYITTASGKYSHAEGGWTTASGQGSHAEGNNTIASGNHQHVQGKYNIEDTTDSYAHIVGNGASDVNRSNAHTLDWNGNAWFAGDVYVGSTSGKDKDEGSKKLVTEADLASLAAQITEAVSQKSQIQLITWEADD